VTYFWTFWDSLHISRRVEGRNFKFGTQIGHWGTVTFIVVSSRMVKDIDRCHVMSARLMSVELNWWPTDCLDSSAVIVARDARD